MPRKKKGAPPSFRGNFSQSAPRHFAARPPLQNTASFSLADEARQTGQSDHSAWDQSTRLRSKPVSFVSAGTTAPLELLEEALLNPEAKEPSLDEANVQPSEDGLVLSQSQLAVADDSLGTAQSILHDEVNIHKYNDAGSNVQDSDEAIIGPDDLEATLKEEVQPSVNQTSFFIDLKGDAQPTTTTTPPTVPDRSSLEHDQSESSDEEVILFKGRDNVQGAGTVQTTMTMSQMRTEIQVVEHQLQSTSPKKRLVRGRGGKGRRPRRNDEDDAMLEDYIANMRETGEISSFITSDYLNQHDLGESLSYDSTDKEDLGITQHGISNRSKAIDDRIRSESELDDETLARLIAVQGPSSTAIDADLVGLPSDSDSSAFILTRPQDKTAIEQFDLMDWERPSIKKKKKGKAARGQINFGLSDSELEQQLQSAYKSDRLKKAQRKQEREELRARGQLGKSARSPEDMMAKYPGGMTMDQVAEEIKSFMMSGKEALTLPPMDPNARKIIHEIANKFNIKSKSTGKGDERRPTLNRTGKTLPYVEGTFDSVINRIHRRYLPRPDSRRKHTPGKVKPVRGGGNHAAVNVRNGEIVGAAAPELGSSNRGRVMLEKMGWSSGTALGSENNKGILQPVAQTMKTNKAGLG